MLRVNNFMQDFLQIAKARVESPVRDCYHDWRIAIRKGATFFVVWWDAEHQIYPTEKG